LKKENVIMGRNKGEASISSFGRQDAKGRQ